MRVWYLRRVPTDIVMLVARKPLPIAQLNRRTLILLVYAREFLQRLQLQAHQVSQH
jgi:hypothetical protein